MKRIASTAEGVKSLEDLSHDIANAILEDEFLKKGSLQPRIKALLSAFMKKANSPKNLNETIDETERGRYILANHNLNTEKYFWRQIVKSMVSREQMEKYYAESDKLLGKPQNKPHEQ